MQNLRVFLSDSLVRQARLFEAMTDSLRLHLSAEVAAHCWVGGIRERTLVVVTDSTAFFMLVHYQQHDILKRINSDFKTELACPLNRLKTRIAKRPPETKKAMQRPKLSHDSGRDLAHAAATIADPEVRDALTRLAARAGKCVRN
jgi:hypothetical protein